MNGSPQLPRIHAVVLTAIASLGALAQVSAGEALPISSASGGSTMHAFAAQDFRTFGTE